MPRDSRIRLLRLRRERFALAVGADHALARRAEVRLPDLDRASWIMPSARSSYGAALRAVCRRHGFEPSVVHEVTDTAATMVLAAEGVGIAPVTDLMLRLNPAVHIRRVRLSESVTRDVVLVVPEGVRTHAVLHALVEVVREVVSRSAAQPALERARHG